MKDAAEIIGIIALWVLGMTATVPASWPVWLLVLAAILSAIAIVLYAARAIVERRSGSTHYFTMALIAVTLTFISLGVSAIQLQGGAQFLLYLIAGCVLVFLLALLFKYRKQSSSSAA